MGGFTITGPNYHFTNRSLTKTHCRCRGFSCTIDGETEKKFFASKKQKLNPDDLPETERSKCRKSHLGDTLDYEIYRNVVHPQIDWNLTNLRMAQEDEFFNGNNTSENVETPLGKIKQDYVLKHFPEYGLYLRCSKSQISQLMIS